MATNNALNTPLITLANTLTTVGNFALTLTQTAGTNVTLPTTGTLATLAGSESLSNKTLVTPVISTGLTASGSTANDFSASSGTFITSTGANTLSGAVTVNDATTPSITLAAGKTNTGFFQVNGKTSGALKIIAADAAAQTVTLNLAAQTVGAGTLNIPNLGGATKTVAWLESPSFTTPTLGVASATSLATSAASPLLLTNGQLVMVALTSQTVGGATLTIPDFANVSDEFTFKTKSQTMSNKTFVAPVLGAATGTSLSVSGNLTTTAGNVALPTSTATVGLLTINGVSYFHNGGVATSVYFGPSAGHGVTATGANNVVGGSGAGAALTSATDCVLVGASAGAAMTSTGAGGSICIGTSAGASMVSAGSIVAIGYLSGQLCTGIANTFVGTNCGIAATSAASCVLVGAGAGQSITTTGSSGTTAIGYQALNALVAGGSTNGASTAVGYQALLVNTANTNTAVGASALGAATTSAYNTAVGQNALGGALTSAGGNSINTAIGYNAGAAYTTGDRLNICIGSQGTAGHSSEIVIGFTNNSPGGVTTVQSKCFIDGIASATAGAGTAVVVTAAGQLIPLASAERFKKNIVDMDDFSSAIYDLTPRCFELLDLAFGGFTEPGLIAEEVEKTALKDVLVGYQADGQTQTVHYYKLPVLLLNELQKLQARVVALEAI